MNNKIFTQALQKAREGAIVDIEFWVENYEKGKCTLYTTIQEILLALGIIDKPAEVKEYENKSLKMVEKSLIQLLNN